MARSTPTRHGASARAGSASSKKKTTTRRAPARGSRAPSRRAPARPKSRSALSLSRRLPLVLVAAVVLLGWTLYPVVRLQYREQRGLDRLQRQLADVKRRNSELKHQVERLKTPQGVEDAARDYGFARKGEQVYVVIPEGGPVRSQQPTGAPVRTADIAPDVWTRALDIVFGIGP